MQVNRRLVVPAVVVAGLLVPSSAATTAAAAPGPGGTKSATLQQLQGRDAGRQVRSRTTGTNPLGSSGLRRLAGQRTADRVVLSVKARRGLSTVAAVAGSTARAEGGRKRLTLSQLGTVTVEVPPAQARAFAARMRLRADVASVTVVHRRSLSLVPDDPQYTAETRYLGAVNAPAAWDVHEGDPNIRIAVVDSGVDVNHPDLAGRVVGTFDAASDATDTTDVTDDLGHGTFVAGVAAATGDNGTGIAGASMGASVLAVKVADENGEIWSDAEAAGIHWAVLNGANVINLSLGSASPDSAESAAISDAVAKGVLVVAAAGNDDSTAKSYPAGYPGVVAVGATDAVGHRASFSNYGSWVTVAAPGVDIRGTTPTTLNPQLALFQNAAYDTADGTSFSAPIVSAEAALLWSLRPTVSAADVRAAIIRSAHGYAGLSLGAGQVDYRAALAALRPVTVPVLTRPAAGTTVAGAVTLSATSTAPKVRFLVRGTPVGSPVATSSGAAHTTWTSWGTSNGPVAVTAQDCSVSDLCGTQTAPAATTLANAAPSVTAPRAAQALTGTTLFTAGAPGGGVAFLIDGVRRGFDAAAPYALPYPVSALTDGTHHLQVRSCSLSGRVCSGPLSAPVSFVARALHPSITSVSPSVFSPNGDRRRDATEVAFRLPDTERVSFLVRTAAGAVARGPVRLGTLVTGGHRVSWDGRLNTGSRAGNGTYTLELVTSRSTSTGTRVGVALGRAVVDLTPPRLSSVTGGGARFYPYPDAYRDTFSPALTLSERSYVTLTVHSARGAVVRSVAGWRSAGRASVTWNGRGLTGHVVPAGTYSWTLVAQDRAGNRRGSARYGVVVSAKRLVARATTLTLHGASYASAGASDTSCAAASKQASDYYPYGVWLANACDPDTSGEIAAAVYRFTVPAAVRYTSLKLGTYGFSLGTSHVGGGFTRWGTTGYTFTPEITVTPTQGWRTVGTVSPSGLVNGSRQVGLTLYVPNDFSRNDFDVLYVRLTVSYKVLA